MSLAPHLYRRHAVYYWRRRWPPSLAKQMNRQHVQMSLGVREPVSAKRAAVYLDAAFEELMEQAQHLNGHQIEGILRNVAARHLAKLDRVAAAKSFDGFNAQQAIMDDRRAAWAYRLLDAKGPHATVEPADIERMVTDGLTDRDIAGVDAHLSMLRTNGMVPAPPHVLSPLLEAQGAAKRRGTPRRFANTHFEVTALGQWIWPAHSAQRLTPCDTRRCADCAGQVVRPPSHLPALEMPRFDPGSAATSRCHHAVML